MMAKKIGSSLMVATLLCSLVLACGGDPASSALQAPQGSASLDRGGLQRHPTLPPQAAAAVTFRGTPCATHVTIEGSGVFGPGGGTLTFGTSSLIIPGGALQDTVTITATSLAGDNSRVEFQPHGLTFAKPAGLLLDTSGCSMDGDIAPNVVYISETGEVLETIPAAYDPHWHTIAAAIEHFSGYAIAF